MLDHISYYTFEHSGELFASIPWQNMLMDIRELYVQLGIQDINSIDYVALRAMLDNQHSYMSVAILDTDSNFKKIVGMAYWICSYRPYGNVAQIQDVVVNRPFRRNGIGTCLLKILFEQIGAAGIQVVNIISSPSNEPFNSMMRKFGFVTKVNKFFSRTLP